MLEVREHPGLAEPRPTERLELTDGLGQRLLVPLAMSASMIPMALTSASTSPWRTVTWLVLPVVLVAAVVWPWLRERASRRRHGEPDGESSPPPPLDPAGLLAIADAPRQAGEVAYDLGTTGRGRRRAPRLLELPPVGQGLALVGPPEACRAMARWLVCQAAHRHTAEDLALVAPAGWDWVSLLPHAQGCFDAAPTTISVLDTTMHDPTAGHGSVAAIPSDAVGILIASTLADVPAWCVRVVDIEERHDRRVAPAWAAEVASTLRRSSTMGSGLPDLVHLRDLVGEPGPDDVLRRWRRPQDGLVAPLGASAAGPALLDLAAAGPHALVAGTTGSGKSELLTTWVLGLALGHAPADLHILLVDYKGGATFGALARLPHVLDVLTDLDTGTTARALASLRAELARREQVLADAGARSLAELARRGERMPRLLVIVDEFRVLADSHPDLLDGLVRLAAQGRSLGIHLVLATQRPGGAVTADMRANISVRLCLRVLEQTDSIDVLGDAAAASLPASPGRAVVRTDVAATVQIAWPGTLDGEVAHLVEVIVAAHELATVAEPDIVAVSAPWAPPLPTEVGTDALPDTSEQRLPLLLVDRPERQRLEGWHLEIAASLLVSGPPGSGRTTAARTLASEAVRRGVVTHAIADEPIVPLEAAARGTTCRTDDVVRVHQLLDALRQAGHGPELLVIDDVDAVCRALDGVLPYGTGQELLLETVRAARRRGLGIVMTATSPAARWAAATRTHVVLAPRDLSDALVAGVPRELADVGAPPGRGVLLDGRSARVGHVAISDAAAPWRPPARPPLRIETLPDVVDLPLDHGPRGDTLLGLGGTDCRPILATLRDGDTWLVLGGPRTGRSTTLRTIAARLRAAGRPVWTDPTEVEPRRSGVLVVDDADRLAPAAAAAAADRADGLALVAGARPEPLAGAYHELARRLRDPDTVLVLGAPAGTAPWTGQDLRALADPVPRPGRAVLVTAGTAVGLQVDRCNAARQSTGVDCEGRLVAAIDAGSSRPTPTASDAASAG